MYSIASTLELSSQRRFDLYWHSFSDEQKIASTNVNWPTHRSLQLIAGYRKVRSIRRPGIEQNYSGICIWSLPATTHSLSKILITAWYHRGRYVAAPPHWNSLCHRIRQEFCLFFTHNSRDGASDAGTPSVGGKYVIKALATSDHSDCNRGFWTFFYTAAVIINSITSSASNILDKWMWVITEVIQTKIIVHATWHMTRYHVRMWFSHEFTNICFFTKRESESNETLPHFGLRFISQFIVNFRVRKINSKMQVGWTKTKLMSRWT